MTNMVEKCARAMHVATGNPLFAFEELSGVTQNAMRVNARAALEAMLEPTEEMVKAGLESYYERTDDPIVRDDVADLVFTAMIQSALAHNPGEEG